MRVFALVFMVSLSASLFAETVVKTSNSFSFPTTVGVLNGSGFTNHDVSFNYWPGSSATSNAISLSWAVPAGQAKGTISIFNVAGVKIASIAISSPYGMVKWGAKTGLKHSKGVYLATLSYGTFKKSLKLITY